MLEIFSGGFEYKLKKLPNFGTARPENHENNFEFPSPADIERLNLTKPLRLKEIKVKGENSNPATAIQLVYEDNIESPLFDTKYTSNVNELQTINIADKPIKKFGNSTCASAG